MSRKSNSRITYDERNMFTESLRFQPHIMPALSVNMYKEIYSEKSIFCLAFTKKSLYNESKQQML